jgi:hypothetical protein
MRRSHSDERAGPDAPRGPDDAPGALPPDDLELAHGSESHLLDEVRRQAEIDELLQAYLRDAPGPRVELVLYVVGGSESCATAVRNLFRMVAGYDPRDVEVTIRDLRRQPRTAADPPIIAVPTLVVRRPRLMFVSGDLQDDTSGLIELLRRTGVRRRAG